MDPPSGISLDARQDSPTTLAAPDPSFVLGPLIVSNAVAWFLWGMLSLHLVLFIQEVRRRRARRLRGVVPNSMPRRRFAWFGGRKAAEERTRNEEINPWTMSFAAPSISAYPSQARQTNASPRQHARHRSTKSALSSSQDPYSPTSAVDQDSHSVLLPSHDYSSHDSTFTSSLVVILMASIVYILVFVHSVLSTAQFWRTAVAGWGSGNLNGDGKQAGDVVAGIIPPLGAYPKLSRSALCLLVSDGFAI